MTMEVSSIPRIFYSGSGLAASRPAAASVGNGGIYYATDTKDISQVQSGSWVTVFDSSSIGTAALVVSDTLRNSNDTEKTTDSQTYVKLKEVLLNADLAVCRIKFGIKRGVTYTACGRIYKNGAAIGTERTVNSDTYQTYSEDFAGFLSGDLIQIYCKVNDPLADIWVNNVRFYYSEAVTDLVAVTLASSLLSTTDPTISVTNQDP